ncbi:ETX/MTX2 family pore-forming toxin [Paenibacillus thiaminolyticus]|uniref:ETX/MTX2 family pore-forming toxin n=1 Tax=Paenibacillus thiaminolyticus TaxID=49283 RepID=UPI0035A6F76C
MKIRFKQKKLSLMTLGIVLGLSSTMFFGSNAMAAANITDVDTQMNKISDFYYKNEFDWKYMPGGVYRYIRLDSKKTVMDLDLKTSPLKNITYSDLTPEYVGENEFDNTHNPTEGNFKTVSYSHAVTNSASTTVSEGFKVGGKSTIFKLPVLLTGGIDITAEFNSATSTTNTVTDTKTLTVPPQDIKVPAGKKYLVKVDMAKKSFSGDLDFSATGKNAKSTLKMLATYSGAGFPRPNQYPSVTYATADMWKKLSNSQQSQVGGVKFDSSKNLLLTGKAKVNGIFGSKLRVTVYDITNKSGIQPRSAEIDSEMKVVSQKFIDLE